MSIEIQLKRSLIGVRESQVKIANSLGLKRVGDKSVQPSNGATLGKVHKIAHLLSVVENASKKGEKK